MMKAMAEAEELLTQFQTENSKVNHSNKNPTIL